MYPSQVANLPWRCWECSHKRLHIMVKETANLDPTHILQTKHTWKRSNDKSPGADARPWDKRPETKRMGQQSACKRNMPETLICVVGILLMRMVDPNTLRKSDQLQSLCTTPRQGLHLYMVPRAGSCIHCMAHYWQDNWARCQRFDVC